MPIKRCLQASLLSKTMNGLLLNKRRFQKHKDKRSKIGKDLGTIGSAKRVSWDDPVARIAKHGYD